MPPGDVPDGILHNEKNNVDYVPSDINLSSADFYLSQALARESVLKRILSSDRFEECYCNYFFTHFSVLLLFIF